MEGGCRVMEGSGPPELSLTERKSTKEAVISRLYSVLDGDPAICAYDRYIGPVTVGGRRDRDARENSECIVDFAAFVLRAVVRERADGRALLARPDLPDIESGASFA
ncbi:hypothetical protein EVAR_12823_1 [Eumeta japonica]|uniref:Uncharacterized protein n=1 Tax=Eumeta variegata TaxID=151549 RepID=A0A4C1UAW8_EUMVA|nr:hypothetical protein EVAR_12823_1 [Eumeta japonica]